MCASIRSKMADVKLGVMPSEGLTWPHAAARVLEGNLSGGEVHSRRSDSHYWNGALSSQMTSDTDWLLHVQAQPHMFWLSALINLRKGKSVTVCTSVEGPLKSR